MGFKDSQRLLIAALKTGSFEHEERDVISEKNLLAVGDVTVGEVITALHRCRGGQYETRPHDSASDVTVHIFRPEVNDERWYIKAYFISTDATFISVHK